MVLEVRYKCIALMIMYKSVLGASHFNHAVCAIDQQAWYHPLPHIGKAAPYTLVMPVALH